MVEESGWSSAPTDDAGVEAAGVGGEASRRDYGRQAEVVELHPKCSYVMGRKRQSAPDDVAGVETSTKAGEDE